jgi:predicted RNase H-like nuclease
MGARELASPEFQEDRLFHFIGIDLAWSGHKPTGIAALRWQQGVATLVTPLLEKAPRSDDDIVDYVGKVAGQENVIVAVDAPLVVPNETGQRWVDNAIGKAFGKFDAAAHSANRERLAAYNNGVVRGEILVTRFAELGIHHNPVFQPQQPARQVFEVYPHPAMVVLFGLDKTLKYKHKGKKRPFEERMEAFRVYQRHLDALKHSIPPAVLDETLLSEDRLVQRGLKNYEDQLDAAFCAYIALYYWWWGAERCHIFGNLERGYIVSPVDERISLA